MARMLLSHNFNLFKGELPALNREQFAKVFIDGLRSKDKIRCSMIANPHWIVEILYSDEFSAADIGKMCGEILLQKRQEQKSDAQIATDTLLLGGKKTTPVTSSLETSLQTGEWGVDVVETLSADVFLDSIGWNRMTEDKPADSIFKIVY